MLTRLYDHMAWADANTREALRAMASGSPEMSRATDLYAHLAATEHVWLSRLVGRPAAQPVWPSLDLETAARLASETVGELRALVTRLDAKGLAHEVEYTNSAGRSFRSRADDILIHIALHGAYHRGQIALLTRQGGSQPASTDYIAFARGAPAATRV